MQRSSPLRWFAAIGIMLLVTLIAFLLLVRTMSQTIRLSSGASEDPAAGLEDASAQPSEQASEGGGDEGGEPSGDFPQNYTVADGDTGASIAERFYGDPEQWPAIAEHNDIDPEGGLRVGAELEIPPPPE
jgi:nucleoid-associated protein YgaU